MAIIVKEFVADSYQLISASSPTVPLPNGYTLLGTKYLNRLLKAYSGTSLMLTIAKEVGTTIQIGQESVTFGDPAYTPTPDITEGRLADLQDAWLLLDGVTYPLIDQSRNVFYASYKYDPLKGLPRFCIIVNELNLTRMRIYPAPSQAFELRVFGKFELPEVTENTEMSFLPNYYYMYFQLALAKYMSMVTGRSSAWDEKLEGMLTAAQLEMQSVSPVNLNIDVGEESWVNGSWRVRSGI